MSTPRFSSTLYLVLFCIAYSILFACDCPIFRYYPLHGDFNWGTRYLKGVGPAMAWYGLLCGAALIAVVPALLIREVSVVRLLGGYGWLFPCAAMITCVVLLRRLFI